MKIEMQLRSNLQHIWATAVETVGTFTGQALKSSTGRKEWLKFFMLMGTALAQKEKCPPVPNTPTDAKELVGELRSYAKRLDVEGTLDAYTAVLRRTELMPELVRGARYFLLSLSPVAHSLEVRGYPSAALEAASADYLAAEKRIAEGKDIAQAVLVSVDSFDVLRRAYPNYFLDTKSFMEEVRNVIT